MATRKAAAEKTAATTPAPTPAPAPVAAPAPARAPAAPTLVTITATGPVRVIVERVADRERHENGSQPIVAGESLPFIVHPGQSLRVVDAGEA